MTCSDMFSVMNGDVTTKTDLENALIKAFPAKKTVIGQAFDRY